MNSRGNDRSRWRRVKQAVRWYFRLRDSDLSPALLRRWEEWEAIPENSAVFDEVAQAMELIDAMEAPAAPSAQERAADHYDESESVQSWLAASQPARMMSRRQVLGLGMGLAATAAIAVAGLRWKSAETTEVVSPDRRELSAETGPRRTEGADAGGRHAHSPGRAELGDGELHSASTHRDPASRRGAV